MKTKKVLKIIRNVLLVILIIILLFLLTVFIYDRIVRKKEYKLLDEKGYVNRVSVGDYSLNVFIYGSDTPKHTIVGMAGMGVDDFACTGRYVTDDFADENRIVYVDRAGYGLSDDTSEPQTIERIVSDYRTALKNAGVEAPYVLMPHSLAGPYASYWASEYPDEIEGVFILDGSQINEETLEDVNCADFWDRIYVTASKMGLGRIYSYFADKEARNYPKKEDVDISWAMYNCRGAYSKAKYSEGCLEPENVKKAWYTIKPNSIPKMYICASYGAQTIDEVREMIDYSNRVEGTSMNFSDEQLNIILKQMKEQAMKDVEKFCEHIGSCEIRCVPGSHYIFCHKPEQVSECLHEFLAKLDKNNA